MGYLSCKAESSIQIQTPSKKPTKSNNFLQQNEILDIPINKKIEYFSYSDLEAATNNFSDQKLLGRGSHGLVYKAILRNGRLVAVKKASHRQSTTVPENELDNEIDILSKLHSPRLVNLVGFTNTPHQNRLLVVEFMSNGTLYDTIHVNQPVPNWGRRIQLALQTAKAIETLHSSVPPVIHRDIKSANVLIDRNYNARLGDFGLALRCHVDDFRLLSTPPAGTMGYLDPGYVTPDNLSTKTDVFSFGILLLEIISGRKAIDVSYSPPSIVDWAIPLIRRGKLLTAFDPRTPPPKDPMVRKQLAVIAAKCVRSCRERRPSMSDIVESLTILSKLVPLRTWNGLANRCMMVETVGRPVEAVSTRVKGNGKVVSNNPRRVYSDLGLRNNLMDLMAGGGVNDEDGSKKPKVREGSRFKNEASSFRSVVDTFERNRSIGDSSKRFFSVSQSYSCVQTTV
ncbi:serine/threonine-protein kinase-like protein At3g51990 [Rutidosis leptorrhynchoides]|uniref:serine/threonine-protein kinase-like protein At3g51990 n=1 Tax=Rutidosis leptorrhynchoides TaxID=125765 RepID=UPI003A996B07